MMSTCPAAPRRLRAARRPPSRCRRRGSRTGSGPRTRRAPPSSSSGVSFWFCPSVSRIAWRSAAGVVANSSPASAQPAPDRGPAGGAQVRRRRAWRVARSRREAATSRRAGRPRAPRRCRRSPRTARRRGAVDGGRGRLSRGLELPTGMAIEPETSTMMISARVARRACADGAGAPSAVTVTIALPRWRRPAGTRSGRSRR